MKKFLIIVFLCLFPIKYGFAESNYLKDFFWKQTLTCWSIPLGYNPDPDKLDPSYYVGVKIWFSPNAKIQRLQILDHPSDAEPRYRILKESIIIAIKSCSYEKPPQAYKEWKELTFIFDSVTQTFHEWTQQEWDPFTDILRYGGSITIR
tara:strand:- start:433 stop:879 length:447 start_codon:yes stop_codon:yes gene_type:complete